jgi:hypothetical protein
MQAAPSGAHMPQSMPQIEVASPTQMLSQLELQQKGSTSQICFSQAPHAGSRAPPTSQTE